MRALVAEDSAALADRSCGGFSPSAGWRSRWTAAPHCASGPSARTSSSFGLRGSRGTACGWNAARTQGSPMLLWLL